MCLKYLFNNPPGMQLPTPWSSSANSDVKMSERRKLIGLSLHDHGARPSSARPPHRRSVILRHFCNAHNNSTERKATGWHSRLVKKMPHLGLAHALLIFRFLSLLARQLPTPWSSSVNSDAKCNCQNVGKKEVDLID